MKFEINKNWTNKKKISLDEEAFDKAFSLSSRFEGSKDALLSLKSNIIKIDENIETIFNSNEEITNKISNISQRQKEDIKSIDNALWHIMDNNKKHTNTMKSINDKIDKKSDIKHNHNTKDIEWLNDTIDKIFSSIWDHKNRFSILETTQKELDKKLNNDGMISTIEDKIDSCEKKLYDEIKNYYTKDEVYSKTETYNQKEILSLVKKNKTTSKGGYNYINDSITDSYFTRSSEKIETEIAASTTNITTRIIPRITTITSSATPTINTDNCDAVTITALATAITSMTTNLSWTPNNFDKLIFRIKDDGTARAITRWSSFEAKWVALPTTTTISRVLTVWFLYDTVTSKRWCVASVEEAMALTSWLYAYYKLDWDATDVLWINGWSATSVTRPAWKINQCASFNTATIEIANNAEFNVGEWSIAFWMKTSYTSYQPVMAMNDNINDNRYIATSRTTSSKVWVYDFTWTAVIEWTASVCDGSRHHIVITSDATSTIFYIDWASSGTFSGAIMYSWVADSNINIWYRAFDADYLWDLDEIWFRNRVLTSWEVSQLYNWWVWL